MVSSPSLDCSAMHQLVARPPGLNVSLAEDGETVPDLTARDSVTRVHGLTAKSLCVSVSLADDCETVSCNKSADIHKLEEVLPVSSMEFPSQNSGISLMRKFKYSHPKNFIMSHYNVNSIRWKFVEVREILDLELVDFFGISETKLSPNFFNDFNVPNYSKPYRQDRNENGGGIMVYIKDSLPHRLLSDHSGVYEGIDYLSFELIMK